MKILTIVGKVDSRVLAYPLARALSLNGLTALISDDGAYRRLFHGDELQGTVSGVDVSVGYKADEDLKNSLNDTGIPYDNIVFVSSGYIPPDSTGVILCHGVDRSMVAKSKDEEEEEELKQQELEKQRKEEEALANKKKERGGSKFGKKKEAEVTNSSLEAGMNVVSSDGETESSAEMEKEELKVKEVVKDKIIIPEGMNWTEMQISYNSPSKKGLPTIQLKDAYLNYVYSCEDMKELQVYPDKNYNKVLAKILVDTLGMDATEATSLVSRPEHIKGGKK